MSEAPSFFEVDPEYGRALAFYPSNRERPLIISAVLTVILSGVLNFTLAQAGDAGGIATMLISGGFVLLCGWYLISIWNREVVLYERGFSYREGSRVIFFRFGEIAGVRQRAQVIAYFGGLFKRRVFRFTLRTVRDELIVLTNLYKRVEELGVQLEQRVTQVRRPLVEYDLKQGNTVPFGEELSLTARSVRNGDGRSLPWEDFGGYTAQAGRLVVLDKSGASWHSVPLDQIENLGLLLEQFKEHTPVPALKG